MAYREIIKATESRATGVANLTALRAVVAAYQQGLMAVEGLTTAGDGLGGIYWWDSASSAADDSLLVIKPDSNPATGRWRRISARASTQTQVDTGTDTATYVTPLTLATRPIKNVVFETYIDGLAWTWGTPGTNGSNFTVKAGAAYVPGLGRILNVPSDITGPSGTFAASTWYYVYLYDNAGTPAVEFSTTVPTNYKGTAWTKTGDNTRRLVDAFKTATGGSPRAWYQERRGDIVMYSDDIANAPFMIMNAATPAAGTIQTGAQAVVPAYSFAVYLGISSAAGTFGYWQLPSVDPNTDTALVGTAMIGGNATVPAGPLPLDSTQRFILNNASTATLRVNGYHAPR